MGLKLSASAYSYDIQYRKGIDNTALSRLPLLTVPTDVPLPGDVLMIMTELAKPPIKAVELDPEGYPSLHCASRLVNLCTGPKPTTIFPKEERVKCLGRLHFERVKTQESSFPHKAGIY